MHLLKLMTLITVLSVMANNANAIVMGENPVRVEVSKGEKNLLKFDVVNLKMIQSAVSAAKWIYQLSKDTEGKSPHYSNSVYLHFSSKFTDKEVQKVCNIFEVHKVYIDHITIDKGGKRVVLEYEPDADAFLEAMLETGDLTPEEREGLKQMLKKTKKAQQVVAPDR